MLETYKVPELVEVDAMLCLHVESKSVDDTLKQELDRRRCDEDG